MKNTQFKFNSDFPRVERHKRSADTTFIKTTTEKYTTTRRLIRLPEVMNKTVFGILLDIPNLHENDVDAYRAQGQTYIESVLNKSKP